MSEPLTPTGPLAERIRALPEARKLTDNCYDTYLTGHPKEREWMKLFDAVLLDARNFVDVAATLAAEADAEIERLREALELIRDRCHGPLAHCAAIEARKALESHLTKPRRRRRQPGSARRPRVRGRWHNAPNGKRVKVCGEVMRIGGQFVEIPDSEK